jgi:hypothetical protein
MWHMHGPDQYLAVIVGALFFTGLIVAYMAVRQRSLRARNWDTALVGVRAQSVSGEGLQKSAAAGRE